MDPLKAHGICAFTLGYHGSASRCSSGGKSWVEGEPIRKNKGYQTPHRIVAHWLSGWPKKSPNFIFATKMVIPKSLKFMNSGSEVGRKTWTHHELVWLRLPCMRSFYSLAPNQGSPSSNKASWAFPTQPNKTSKSTYAAV